MTEDPEPRATPRAPRPRRSAAPTGPDPSPPRASRARWDARHAASGPPGPASAFVSREVRRLGRARPGARALDFACGSGRHAALLAAEGWVVVALDASRQAIRRTLAAAPGSLGVVADAERVPLRPERFGLVVVTCFLDRTLFASALATLLEPGGVLIAETFTREHFARAGHPRRDFCLTKGELDALCASSSPRLEIIARSRTRPGPGGAPPGLEGVVARRA